MVHDLLVDPSQPWEARRLAIKYMSKGARINIRDKDMQILSLQTCVTDVIEDGTNTIFLVPQSEMAAEELTNVTLQNNSSSLTNNNSQSEEPKRKKVLPTSQ